MTRLVSVLFTAIASSALSANDSPLGEWWTPGFRGRVAIERCGGSLCGRVVWTWDPRTVAVGREVLKDLRPDGRGGFNGGRAFNPDDGNDYAASLRMLDPDRLIVEGCLAFLCREQVWLRVGSPPVLPAHARGMR